MFYVDNTMILLGSVHLAMVGIKLITVLVELVMIKTQTPTAQIAQLMDHVWPALVVIM